MGYKTVRYATNMLIVVFLTATFAPAQDAHSLDRANQALESKEYSQAVALCEEALADEHTAEAYNTLGLARERLGQCDRARDAYRMALKLDPDNQVIRQNSRRALVRHFLSAYRIYALYLFASAVGFLVISALKKSLVRRWRQYRLRRKFRGVQCSQTKCLVRDDQGRIQEDGYAYPDTGSVQLEIVLAVPPRTDIYPFGIRLDVCYPTGQHLRRIDRQVTLDCVSNGEARVLFSFDKDLAEMLQNDGAWKYSVVLEPVSRVLLDRELRVVSRAMLLRDLSVHEFALLATQDGNIVAETVIPSDIQAISTYIRLSPSNYLAAKYEGVEIHIELLSPESSVAISCETKSLCFDNGQQEIFLEHPVVDSPLARQLGDWRFEVSIEDRTLATLSFTVVDRQEAMCNFKLADVTLAGIGPRGSVFALGNTSYRRPKFIVPVFTFVTNLPSRLIHVPVSLGICVDGEPITEYAESLQIAKSTFDWGPGEYELPEWEDDRQEMQIAFVLFIHDQIVTTSCTTIHRRAPRCANAQGQLTNIRHFHVDESEAAAIFTTAEVRA